MDVKVRFEEKDAIVRYHPSQVTLGQILKRYESTPFGVTLAGSVVTIARAEQVVLRGWTERTKLEAKETDSDDKRKDDTPQPIQVYVEAVVEESAGVTVDSDFSFAEPAAEGLAAFGEFEKAEVRDDATANGSSNLAAM